MTTDMLYRPKNGLSLDKVDVPQIRLGIQGDGGTGKTWAALTFPNPIVIDIDRGLGAHRGRSEVISIPVWDINWRKTNYSRDPENIRQCVEDWISTEGIKMMPNQTLIVDGNSGLQRHFHDYEEKHPVVTKSGKYDDRSEWSNKIKYYGRILEFQKSLQCHVVWIFHEQPERNDKGDLTGKIKPVLSGQVGDQIKGDFTDWVRSHAIKKPDDPLKIDAKKLAVWGMKTPEEFKAMCDSFVDCPSIYYWQMFSDDVCNTKVSSLVNSPPFLPANYQSFIKYLRK